LAEPAGTAMASAITTSDVDATARRDRIGARMA
jgi:hypothetical protein